MRKAAVLLFLLLSLSFASQLWKYSTDGPTTAKPVVFQGAVVAASDDGNIYAINPASGQRNWQAAVGKAPNELTLTDGTIVVSTTGGKLTRVGNNGAIQWQVNLNTSEYNVSRIYGAGANAKDIYVTTNTGVFSFDKSGNLRARLMTFNDSILTAPAVGENFVIFGKGKELIRLSETGATQWKATLSEDSFWLSKPVLEGGMVYIGALDDRMHAYVASNGLEIWSARARNWVLGTALVLEGVVYFGANDGNVYAVDTGSGSVRWVAHTQLAVHSRPEPGLMGGTQVIFVGGSDRNVYAISRDSGEIVWKGSSAGGAGSPLFYQNEVIFGSDDGNVYSYSTERACSITSPPEAGTISRKELVVSGKYVSEAGGARVMVQVNGGQWEDANTSDVDWTFIMDPSAKLSPGLNTISCQVADSGGSETGETFTTVAITHDPGIPLSNLVVSASPDIVEGRNFTIFVNDGDDGSPVERFTLQFNGMTYSGNRNITLTAPASGQYPLAVSKIGFNENSQSINVNPSGVPLHIIAIGAILIIAILWFLWTRVLSKRLAKKKK
ncbi:MAG: PQQ-binding-like beta-propeller repeat protein [Candidatus Micrarchaeota archaeon]